MNIITRVLICAIVGGVAAFVASRATDSPPRTSHTAAREEHTPRDRQMFIAGVTVGLVVYKLEGSKLPDIQSLQNRSWFAWTNGFEHYTNTVAAELR